MRYTTNLTDKAKLESAKIKAERLCKLYKCSLLDLLVLSIDGQAEIRQAEQVKSTKLN